MSVDVSQFFPMARARRTRITRRVVFPLLLLLLVTIEGCSRFHGPPPEYVYVSAKQRFMRDRLAVIANRVAEITNGERLQVIEHQRRFLKVKTPQGKVGWIEEHSVIDQNEFDQFQELAKQHAKQKPVASAKLYDFLYMHVAPGRNTQHFYLLPPNAQLELLERASVPRDSHGVLGLSPQAGTPQPVRMEDWWLARDSHGHTGWMLAGDLDIEVPQAVAQYSESEQMLAAYVLRTVDDPDAGVPGGKVPEYLTVLRPYQSGLPYDFDQIRVFTWSTHRHHYETAFRLRNIAGFFPVKVISGGVDAAGNPVPEFSFQVADDSKDLRLDPQTGIERPTHLKTVKYRMEGNLVKAVTPPGTKAAVGAPPKTHPRIHHRSAHRSAHRGKTQR